jgi:pterin-4a-carbinolamine dehydratase
MPDDLVTQLERLAELLKHHHLSENEYTRANEKLYLSNQEMTKDFLPHLERLAELYDHHGLSEEEFKEAKFQLSRRFNFE